MRTLTLGGIVWKIDDEQQHYSDRWIALVLLL
jgi:hypothetical protein